VQLLWRMGSLRGKPCKKEQHFLVYLEIPYIVDHYKAKWHMTNCEATQVEHDEPSWTTRHSSQKHAAHFSYSSTKVPMRR
jgi:hypothetical protein